MTQDYTNIDSQPASKMAWLSFVSKTVHCGTVGIKLDEAMAKTPDLDFRIAQPVDLPLQNPPHEYTGLEF